MFLEYDKSMMDYQSKDHREGSPSNKSDAFCIIEFKKDGDVVNCSVELI
ncbi:hypothetical protein H311_00495 [Anncaliia algerae PRA109]|nr:hypothetical protein H311_00495 [Anncaliia algerae PRA109]